MLEEKQSPFITINRMISDELILKLDFGIIKKKLWSLKKLLSV